MAELDETQVSEASVGVLGWLGFIIVNFAAWGIITTASTIFWVLGFLICLLYTAALVGLAVWLERRGAKKYHQFLNLLWVLSASFVFILGLYIAFQVIGKVGSDNAGGGGGGGGSPPINNDVETLLPSGASTKLREWARRSSWRQGVDFATLGGTVFFEGADDQGGEALRYVTEEGTIDTVSPRLSNAAYFVEFESKLLCVGRSPTSSAAVWEMDESGNATQVTDVLPDNVISGEVQQLFTEDDASMLFLRARYECTGCPWNYIDTILNTSQLSMRPTDARGADPCSSLCVPAEPRPVLPDHPGASDGSNYKATLWGVILVAALPMMVLAGVVLVKKQMPGLFVNLYGGVVVVVVVAYLLANYDTVSSSGPRFANFLKAFLTTYTVVLWLTLAGWSIYSPSPVQWLEELKSWAVAFVGVSFFVIIHIDLEIPFRDDAWRWMVYALVTLWQLLLSAVVSRTVPMVSGAIGLFVLAYKISWEIVEFAGLRNAGELQLLAVLALMALQGIGIIVGAIFYAGSRERIEEMVRAALRCNMEKLKEINTSPSLNTSGEV